MMERYLKETDGFHLHRPRSNSPWGNKNLYNACSESRGSSGGGATPVASRSEINDGAAVGRPSCKFDLGSPPVLRGGCPPTAECQSLGTYAYSIFEIRMFFRSKRRLPRLHIFLDLYQNVRLGVRNLTLASYSCFKFHSIYIKRL